MANLFARATANWNAANQWNTAADGSGSFVTPAAGDVCMANGFTVTINVNVTVAEVRNDTTGGATDGGTFSLANGVTLTSNVLAGSVTDCVIYAGAAPNSAAISGEIIGGTALGMGGASLTGTGTLNITGSSTGGPGNSSGIYNNGQGIINLTGNSTGGASGSSSHGVRNNSTGAINLYGNCIAHASSGSAGVANVSSGRITIYGYLQSNNYGPGSTGVLAGYAAQNSSNGVIEVSETRSGARGLPAVSGAFRYASATAAISKVRATSGLTETNLRPIAAVVPAVADVKSGVVYGDGAYTGTLATSAGLRRTNMSSHMG